ncbi:MAG: hypothetical protein PHE55_22860 [Methylococcaceae bacterium]|nr:hypothetical protein [Methylococcaceae bacterium]
MNIENRIGKLEQQRKSKYDSLTDEEIAEKLASLKRIAREVLTPKEHSEMTAWIEHQCAARK